jgi:tetratricopeptide (TPR) repeat protein
MTQIITATGNGVVYAVQDGDQYVYIYQQEPPYRVERFQVTPNPVSDALAARAPSWLLSARHRVIAFSGREPELAALAEWRDGPVTGASVRLVHGPGGQGKTRLAAEFAEQSAAAGWSVAVARHRSEIAAAGRGDAHLAVRAPGLMLMVDYAERWPLADLITLIDQHHRAARTALRVLLLARPTDWWPSLTHQLNKLDVAEAAALALPPLVPDPAHREAMFAKARDRFADVLHVPDPHRIPSPADLGQDAYGLVLTLHMAALAAVDAAAHATSAPTDPAGLSVYLLGREREHWTAVHHHGQGPIATPPRVMARTVYTATLVGPLDHRTAVEVLRRTDPDARDHNLGQILTDQAVCYPPADAATVLEPLYPDRLGEDFIALLTPGHHSDYPADPWTADIPAALLQSVTRPTQPLGNADTAALPPRGEAPAWTRQALTVLIEAAHRWPHLANRQLYPLLEQQPDLAIDAGGAALAGLATIDDVPIRLLEKIEALLPAHRHVDLDIGIATLTRRLATHRLAAATDPAEQAGLHHDLGWRLGQAGQHQAALAAIGEAVGIRRRLAADNPAAFEPGLATSLATLSSTLSELGQREEALGAVGEVVDIRLRLATDKPGEYELDLARSLSNLGAVLTELGRSMEALAATREAVVIIRRLAPGDPDTCNPDLAASLSNLSVLLSAVGLRDEALAAVGEAVSIHRRLAAGNPAAFEPDLAASIDNLGIMLRSLARHAEALAAVGEAVGIHRRLAAGNPAAFEPDLAASIDNLGAMLNTLGRHEKALAATAEAVDIWRRLAPSNPAAFEPRLAASVDNLGIMLWNAGRHEESLAAHGEAVDVYRRLTASDRTTFEPDFAAALSNLGITQWGLGRQDQALAATGEAVDIYGRLATGNRLTFEPHLAKSLTNLGLVLLELGHHEEAHDLVNDAVVRYKPFIRTWPGVYEGDLRRTYLVLAEILDRLGRTNEATGLRRQLGEDGDNR